MRLFRQTILTILTIAAASAQTKFEVASIRQSPPGIAERALLGLHIDGSQVRCSSFSLRDYIGMAYKLKIYQISGPDWLTSQKYDISAKIPDGVPASEVPAMFAALLEERFGLKFHRETRDFPVYALIIGKGGSRLTESKADPDAAPVTTVTVAANGGSEGVSVDLGNGASFTVGSNKLEGRRLTMQSFVDSLARFTDRPIIDQTALPGIYDFKIDVTPEDFTAMIVRSAISAGVQLPPQALRALEFGSSESLFSGIEKLGLKLDPRKAPLEFYVIDHMEKTPTEN